MKCERFLAAFVLSLVLSTYRGEKNSGGREKFVRPLGS